MHRGREREHTFGLEVVLEMEAEDDGRVVGASHHFNTKEIGSFSGVHC